MKTCRHSIAVLLVSLLTVTLLFTAAGAEAEAHGSEDVSTLTYRQLQALLTDISSANQKYHSPTDAEKNGVLSAVQAAVAAFYTPKGYKIDSWAWYGHEYTYTKDWDFFTLKTHVNYKDSSRRSYKAIIYAEVYLQNGRYTPYYLKTDSTVITDHRADFKNVSWIKEPKALINQATSIDLSTYTVKELDALRAKVSREINKNHSVQKNEASIILSTTKSKLEQYCFNKNIEITSYAWYDSEYIYKRDWDYYWLETHVNYKTSSSSSQKKDKLFSEICKINGNYELVFLKMGNTEIVNRKSELETAYENGIPRYNWIAKADSSAAGQEAQTSAESGQLNRTTPEATPEIVYITWGPQPEVTPEVIYVTAKPQPEVTPEIIYVTAEPQPGVTPEIIDDMAEPQPEVTPFVVYITPEPKEGIFSVNLADASDEELEDAINAIRAELKSRIKPYLKLTQQSVTLNVGESQEIKASVHALPDGEPRLTLKWTTSNKRVVRYKSGKITAVAKGKAVITCSATLSDGTVISDKCTVTVEAPVTSLSVDREQISMGVGDQETPEFMIQPKNASNQKLSFASSDETVAAVDPKGVITGVGPGTAQITAVTQDGSELRTVIRVTVTPTYLKHSVGREIYNRVIAGERVTYKLDGGGPDYYEYAAEIDGLSFEVNAYGKDGRALIIRVMDSMKTGKRDLYFKVLDCVFSGDDLKNATEWVRRNLGKRTQTKFGDANIVLDLTTMNYPIMHILEDEYLDWI